MENISKNLLFFEVDDKNSFDSYKLIEKRRENSFKDILIYNISKKVKKIDRKGERALDAMRRLLFEPLSVQEEKIAYNSLDTFLITTPAFRKHIRNLEVMEIENLKRTIISSIIEKIYDNINKKRGVSNLRFALVLLKNGISKLDNSIKSHIFYDIQNGVNINREIENSLSKKTQSLIEQRELAKEVKPNYSNLIESFIKEDGEKRFINIFLKTLLSIHSNDVEYDIKKIATLVSYMSYIISTRDIKTTIKNGIEKIQIAHPFIISVEYQVEHNSLNFILMLDDFLENRDNQEIEEFLERRVSIKQNSIEIKSTTIRQRNLKFLKNLLIIGDFFKLVSEREDIESIIDSIQKKILENSIDIDRYSKEPISSNFLKLFAKEYRKKDCKIRLKDFFKSFRENLLLQKKHQQMSISHNAALTSLL